MKKLFVIIFLFAFMSNVNAEECTEAQIKELKQKAESIVVDTEFYEEDIEYQNYTSNYLIIQGIPEGFYLQSDNSRYLYEYKDNINGKVEDIITNDVETLEVYSNACPNKILRKITLSLKKYNPYSKYKECEGISGDELDICGKYYEKTLSDEEFYEKIKEYKENNKISTPQELNNKNKIKYITIVLSVIVIISIIIILLIKRKKNILD